MEQWALDGKTLVIEVDVAILVVLEILLEAFQLLSDGTVRCQNDIILEQVFCRCLFIMV